MQKKVENKNKSKDLKPLELLVRYIAVKVYSKRNNIPAMYNNLKRLESVNGKKASYHYQLSKLAYEQEMWTKSLEHINDAIRISSNQTPNKFYLRKANSLIKIGESEKSLTFLEGYLKEEPNNLSVIKKTADQYYKLSQWKNAIEKYKGYLESLPTDSKVNIQLADCYFNVKEYQLAEKGYQQAIDNEDKKLKNKSLVVLYYKLGLVKQLNNDEENANKLFTKVLELDKELESQYYGIGVFHEKYNQTDFAIKAYIHQLWQDENNAQLNFKIASLYKKSYQFELAIEYYEKALKLDKVNARWHYILANCYEELKDYKNAARTYQNAIDRNLKHNQTMHRRLGFVLGKLNKQEEALNAYKKADMFTKPLSVPQNFYKRVISRSRIRYAISYENYSVNNKMVFYESMSGGGMMGSPFAIFDHLIKNQEFNDFIHIWVINSFQVIPKEYRAMDNVIFVKKDSDAYFKYINSAKYLICNSTFQPYVLRKPNQYYLQTSHGIFYKTVGRDSSNTPIGVAGGTRNLLQATHIIVPNEYMANKQPKSYSFEGINSGDIAKVGYPRIDLTLNITDEKKKELSAELGIDPSKKIVYYAPTWRGNSKANNRFDSEKLIGDLTKLATLDANILFRGHPITNSLLKEVNLPENIIVPAPHILTNELLGMSDILISDYSSVFFDYIVTERPIIHYLYDLEEYIQERGLNLSESELPGDIAKTSEELVDIISDRLINNEPSSHYLETKERFCTYDDGKSTERVVNWYFKNQYDDINIIKENNKANSYLFLGGELSDTEKIDNLVNELNYLKEQNNTVSLILDRKVAKNKKKLKMLSGLNKDINLIAHDKNMPVTLEEADAIRQFEATGEFISKRLEEVYIEAHRRQARRLLGDSSFDEINNFETNSNYWCSLTDGMLNENKKVKN